MVGRVIRRIGSFVYKHPQVDEDVFNSGAFGRLKIALVTDNFTTECLSAECRIRNLTPCNFREVIGNWQPDLVLVESAFHGHAGSWRYELAKQPKPLRMTKPKAIGALVDFARSRGIPTVFWNKDDDAFFDAFVDVAKLFDYVFTTDSNCLERYRQQVPEQVPVNTLSIPYQPAFHNFDGFNFERKEACFTGSYYRRILNERRDFLDMMFKVCNDVGINLNVYDRNRQRMSHRLEFRYPRHPGLKVYDSVPHRETAEIYKSHMISLNVNSITASESMYSRRLLEILACGGIAVTNQNRAVDLHFRDYCHVVSTQQEAMETLRRLQAGPSQEDLDRAAAGAEYVKENHTWTQRIEEVCSVVGI